MNAQLSCLTCGVRFMPQKADGLDSNESYSLAVSEHKSHLKSDWHRYNLKRKVLEMPAVTEEAFVQKVQQQRAQVVSFKISSDSIFCSRLCGDWVLIALIFK